MWQIFVCSLLLQHFVEICSGLDSIPVIHNASLNILGYNSTTINGTCDECLCVMLLNRISISAFNCIPNNKTCELFFLPLNTSLFWLRNNTASSVFFISLSGSSLATATASTAEDASNFPRKSLLLFSLLITYWSWRCAVKKTFEWNSIVTRSYFRLVRF